MLSISSFEAKDSAFSSKLSPAYASSLFLQLSPEWSALDRYYRYFLSSMAYWQYGSPVHIRFMYRMVYRGFKLSTAFWQKAWQ
jgi:hypothetical protein